MANATHQFLSRIEDLSHQLAHLRQELARTTRPARKAGTHALHDAGHQAVVLAKDFQAHSGAVAHLLGRRARFARKAISKDPVPLVVALGTFVLLSSLLSRRR